MKGVISMMFNHEFWGRTAFANVVEYWVHANCGDKYETEATAEEQNDKIEKKIELLKGKLVKDISTYDWMHVTNQDALEAIEMFVDNLDSAYFEKQELFFKVGFATGLNFAYQLRGLCSYTKMRD